MGDCPSVSGPRSTARSRAIHRRSRRRLSRRKSGVVVWKFMPGLQRFIPPALSPRPTLTLRPNCPHRTWRSPRLTTSAPAAVPAADMTHVTQFQWRWCPVLLRILKWNGRLTTAAGLVLLGFSMPASAGEGLLDKGGNFKVKYFGFNMLFLLIIPHPINK